jgi:hypothetical protein
LSFLITEAIVGPVVAASNPMDSRKLCAAGAMASTSCGRSRDSPRAFEDEADALLVEEDRPCFA